MIVIFRKAGQLGNRLFNFANFIALAADKGLQVSNPSFCEYATHFRATREDPFCRFPPRRSGLSGILGSGKAREILCRMAELTARVAGKLRVLRNLASAITLKDDAFYVLDDNPKALVPFRESKLTFVGGLQFRAISAMRSHRETIKAYFEPISIHRDCVEVAVARARGTCDVLVGVHIRVGDYATHLEGQYRFEIDDYVKLMVRIQKLFGDKKPGFLICSNAPLQSAAFDGLNCHFGPNHFLQDMYCFARCDYIVGPPSTYSLWACYYGEVPLYFVQNPKDEVTLDRFHDYFSIVGAHKVQTRKGGEQFVEINGAEYGLVFPTNKEYLAL